MSETISPNTTIAHYTILSKLGEGGMGEVYLAHDERLHRDVALKILPAAAAEDDTSRARMLREARAAASLNHTNICTIHEVGDYNGQVYIAMEYVDGRPLSECIAPSGLPVGKALRYADQLADALSHAHERKIIHRDLKSGNIVIGSDQRLKVLDFGLAKVMPGAKLSDASAETEVMLTEPGTVVGTLAYMSPEQLRGQQADARSDIWSVGMILAETVTGVRPFQGKTAFELSSAILNDSPTISDTVPQGLRAVIERCLAKDPTQRYQRASELLADLRTASTETPTSVTATQLFAVAAGRKQPLFFGVICIAVVVAVALVWFGRNRLRTVLIRAPSSGHIESLAVLPLQNLSGDQAQDYFASGLHEALIIDLGKFKGLRRVIARSSVMPYQKTDKLPWMVGRELGVDGVVFGSVLRSGNRVRVTAHLVNATTGQEIWGDRYEEEVRDVLSLQNQIVSAITRSIELSLTPEEKQRLSSARSVNPEAYDDYLKGRFAINKFTAEGFERGLSLLHQAIEKDPTNPAFHGELAITYTLIGHDTIPDAFTQAKAAAHKALALDPNCAEAFEALAEISLYFDWEDWAGAERNFQRALSSNPNLGVAHRNYSWYLNLMGHGAEGIQEMSRAVEIDPQSPLFHEDLGWQLWDARQTDKAMVEARRSLECDPQFPFAYWLLANIYMEQGLFTEAIASAEKAAQGEPNFRWLLAQVYAKAGRKESALQLIEQIKRQPSPLANWGLAQVYATMGERDESLKWLERSFQDRFSLLPWSRLEDSGLQRPFKPFRSDPRYLELIHKMNLSDAAARQSQ